MNYKTITKISFYSIFLVILTIVSLTILLITLNDWVVYDSKYLTGENELILPVSVQVYRAILMLSSTLLIATWFATLWEINKIENKKEKLKYFLTGGIFVWTLLPYTFFLAHKNRSYHDFWHYLKEKKDSKEQINLSKWVSSLKGQKDRLFWNTTIFIFLILVVIVDFSLIWAKHEYPINDPSGNIMFNTFSFFTQWTNFAIIIFVFFFLFAHQTIIFRNNTFLILMTSYITVVGFAFWCYLLPFGSFKNASSNLPSLVKTIWLHTVTPISFAFFTISSLFLSKEKPNSFLKIAEVAGTYPTIYGIYAYSLCFVTRHSVYGLLTNLNPNMIDFNSSLPGNPLYSLFFFLIAGTFYLFFFIFWKIADRAYKKGLVMEH